VLAPLAVLAAGNRLVLWRLGRDPDGTAATR
jgi:hypothetical protein